MKIAIIGGGISGLTLAFRLSQAGAEVTLLEEKSQLGGLAASFDLGSYRLEKYYHFVCGGDLGLYRLLQDLGIYEKLKWTESQTGFFYQGKLYPFRGGLDLLRFTPVSLISRLRFGLNVLSARFLRDWKRLDKIPAEKWLIDSLGADAYQVIWEPLLKIKFGRYYNQVSAAWLGHRIFRVSRSRTSLWEKEKMGYIEGGSQTLIDSLAQKITTEGGKILLHTPVSRLLISDDQVTGVEYFGEKYNFDKVIAAIPVPLLINLFSEDSGEQTAKFKERLNKIRYIGVICMALRLKHSLSDYFWVNINDSSMSINGLIEYTNLNPCPKLQGDKIVYVPFYLPTEEERYTFTPQQLQEEYCSALQKINPAFKADWLVDYRVFRYPYAQAICNTNFWSLIPDFNEPLANFYFLDSIHIYPEDRTLSGMAELAYKISDLVLGNLNNYKSPS